MCKYTSKKNKHAKKRLSEHEYFAILRSTKKKIIEVRYKLDVEKEIGCGDCREVRNRLRLDYFGYFSVN